MCEDEKHAFGLPAEVPYAGETGFPPESCFEGNDFTELFDFFLQSKNPNTSATYLRSLRAFSRFLAVSGPREAVATLVSWRHSKARWTVMKYKAHLKTLGFAPATVNLHLSAIKSVVSFARRLGIIPWRLRVPFEKVRPYRDTRGPGIEAIRQLINRGNSSCPLGIRNQAILRLLFDLALRTCEVCRLDIEDVDLDSGTLSVLGKRRTQKEVLTLPDSTREILSS